VFFQTPLTADERLDRVRSNLARAVPRLPYMPEHKRPAAICGYGPSLTRTWQDIQGVVFSTSGAHDFLIERGVIPRYHVECDPRAHKSKFVQRPHKDVTYLINSQCHPLMFNALRGHDVRLWHGFTDDDYRRQVSLIHSVDPGYRVLAGGTNVGMRAIVVARELGHVGFDLHGLDCSYQPGAQWAGAHYGQSQPVVIVEVEGRQFLTSAAMMTATDDFFSLFAMLGPCRYKVHGDGLLDARLRMYLRDPALALSPNWWKPVDFVLRAA